MRRRKLSDEELSMLLSAEAESMSHEWRRVVEANAVEREILGDDGFERFCFPYDMSAARLLRRLEKAGLA